MMSLTFFKKVRLCAAVLHRTAEVVKPLLVSVGVLLFVVVISGSVSGQEHKPNIDTPLSRQPLDHYEALISRQTSIIETLRSQGNLAAEINAILRRAEAYLAMGYLIDAARDVERASKLTDEVGDPYQRAAVLGARGNIRLQRNEINAAMEDFEASRLIAKKHNLATVEAATLINLGNLKSPKDPDSRIWKPHEDPLDALNDYRKAAKLAKEAGRANLTAQAWLGASRMAALQKAFSEAQNFIEKAKKQIVMVADKGQKAMLLVASAGLLREIDEASGNTTNNAKIKGACLQAERLASQINDFRTQSNALACLARLSEDSGNFKDAVVKTRKALFLAQTINATELEFRWQGQLGRLLAKKTDEADIEAAKAAYDSAIDSFARVQTQLVSSGRSLDPRRLRQMIDPVFTEYAKLLLKGKNKVTRREHQKNLERAKFAFERLKGVELQNYFQDACVAELQARRKEPDPDSFKGVAVLYSIVLPRQLILLLRLPDRSIRAFPRDVNSADLLDNAKIFLRDLQDESKTGDRDLESYFYNLLMGHIPQELFQGIHTIAFVPDSILALVPLAALYDEQKNEYLGDRFAVATVPGLDLFDPKPLGKQEMLLLLAGLTQKVKGYPELRYVQDELTNLEKRFQSTVLQDQAFSWGNLNKVLGTKPYTIVHIASHAQFGGSLGDTYLLTAGGKKMHMNDLEKLIMPRRFRKKAIELLTLSACETAKGDERDALGLAGVALKSGARSALASLWTVNDEATSRLMTIFYNNLKGKKMSKAQALQKAQQELREEGKEDPYYWAAFLIIGNWL
jgi:CHAT domain-containing protein